MTGAHRLTDTATVCPWCQAEPFEPCTVIAAHPVTGRAFLLPVGYVHPERVR